MKLAAVAVLLIASIAFADTKREAWNGRPLVVRGKLAAVYIEPVLYKRADVPRGFFVAIWIVNTSDKTIAIDGDGERWFVHPNQWGVSDESQRQTVDERTLTPQKLDAARKAEIKRRIKAKTITMLKPGHSLETHELFDGSSPKDIVAAKGRYFILALDGQVFVSDGDAVESLEAKADGQTAADLVIATPVPWKELPAPSPK